MSGNLNEIPGRNARENTALLLRSIKHLVAEAAQKPFTQRPQPIPDDVLAQAKAQSAANPTRVAQPTVPPTGKPTALRQPPTLSGPVQMEPRPAAPKKSLFNRLFG